jgi:hypothetical protein
MLWPQPIANLPDAFAAASLDRADAPILLPRQVGPEDVQQPFFQSTAHRLTVEREDIVYGLEESWRRG